MLDPDEDKDPESESESESDLKSQQDPQQDPEIDLDSKPKQKFFTFSSYLQRCNSNATISMETEAEPEYGPGGVASLQQSMASSLVGHLENLEFLGTILRDAILHSSSSSELNINATAQNIAESLRSLTNHIYSGIDTFAETNPELIDRIFQVNGMANTIMENYDSVVRYEYEQESSTKFIRQNIFTYILTYIHAYILCLLP